MNPDRMLSWLSFLIAVAALALLGLGAVYYQGKLGYYQGKTEALDARLEERKVVEAELLDDIRLWKAYVVLLQQRMTEAGIRNVPLEPQPPKREKRR